MSLGLLAHSTILDGDQAIEPSLFQPEEEPSHDSDAGSFLNCEGLSTGYLT